MFKIHKHNIDRKCLVNVFMLQYFIVWNGVFDASSQNVFSLATNRLTSTSLTYGKTFLKSWTYLLVFLLLDPWSYNYSTTVKKKTYKIIISCSGYPFSNSFYSLMYWGGESVDKSSFKLDFRHCGGLVGPINILLLCKMFTF